MNAERGRRILVVGGGFIGVAAALRLQAAGFRVVLIDEGDPRRAASFGNAGHIGAEQVVPLASWETLWKAPGQLFGVGGALDFRWSDARLWAPWGLRLVKAASGLGAGTAAMSALQALTFPAWERLLALAGAPSGLVRPTGHLVVWMRPETMKRNLARWERTPTGTVNTRPLTEAELDYLGSHLAARPAGGLRFSGSGQVSLPRAVLEALLAALLDCGGAIETGRVLRLAPQPAGVAAQLEGGRTLRADRALIAAGAWSGRLMRQFGAAAPVIGERGYSVQSKEHSWPDDLPPILFEERMVVVTRFTTGLRATSFTEFGAPDAPPDPRKWVRLERHLSELGIGFSKSPDRWMGPRPTLPDFLPAIGRLQSDPGILYAFGHQHLGLTLAAITAELIEGLALGRAAPFDLAPFRIERFR